MTEGGTILQRISDDRESLSRAFRLIADFVMSTPGEFINSPMRVLAQRIQVSEPTLIRFARHYGYQGLPDLRLAFAMSLAASDAAASATLEPRLRDKQAVNRAAKQAIAARAAALTADDSTLLLDSGSTLQRLADCLTSAPGKTILTTSLNNVLILRQSDQHRLIMPGGTLRAGAMALGGRMAEANLAEMNIDTAYIGADSLHPEHGLSTYGEEEAHLNRAMIRASRRVVVLVDSTKLRSPALHHICDLSDVDIIVTDSNLSQEQHAAFEATDTTLLLADATPPATPRKETP
ncbi:transcriptional regulator [Oceanibium sediminis]|uniref:transcriptional regulator n=1 Tax=Oceanibium sediminis TaxID=2026339 RepID=UPI0018E5A7EE|nr:transcriptional regulator [Oceanibium sediminis]